MLKKNSLKNIKGRKTSKQKTPIVKEQQQQQQTKRTTTNKDELSI